MSSRFTLEDISKMPAHIQTQVAQQLSASPRLVSGIPAARAVTGAAPKRKLGGLGAGRLPVPTESQSQQALIKWWRFTALHHRIDERKLMGFPLQGARTSKNGARLKAEGMRAGTPDLFLALRRGDRCGLWIEMKTVKKGSKLQQSQKEMLKLLSGDYATVVCRSTAEAQAVILAYLAIGVGGGVGDGTTAFSPRSCPR